MNVALVAAQAVKVLFLARHSGVAVSAAVHVASPFVLSVRILS